MRSHSILLCITFVVTSAQARVLEQSAFLPVAYMRRHDGIQSSSTQGRFLSPTVLSLKEDSTNESDECKELNNENDNIQQTTGLLSNIMMPSQTGAVSCSFILPILLAATITMLMPLPATAGEGDIARGATLFNSNCASCHRGGENIMKPAKTLQEKDLVKNLGSADQATLQKFFTNSINHKLLNFPSVPGGKLSETDVLDATSYVSDQALGSKW